MICLVCALYDQDSGGVGEALLTTHQYPKEKPSTPLSIASIRLTGRQTNFARASRDSDRLYNGRKSSDHSTIHLFRPLVHRLRVWPSRDSRCELKAEHHLVSSRSFQQSMGVQYSHDQKCSA